MISKFADVRSIGWPHAMRALVVCAVVVCIPITADAQRQATAQSLPSTTPDRPTQKAPWQPNGTRRSRGGVFKTRITPHWYAGNTQFWYRNDLPNRTREFILVDAVKGTRKTAFDHKRVANALAKAGVKNEGASRLPFTSVAFDLPRNSLFFRAGGTEWRCDLKTYDLTKRGKGQSTTKETLVTLSSELSLRASRGRGPESAIVFVNRTKGEVRIFWLDQSGTRKSYGKVAAGQTRRQHTFGRHVWQVVDANNKILAVFQAKSTPGKAVIDGKPPRKKSSRKRRFRASDQSPDGKWRAFVRDHNVFIRSLKDRTEQQLSRDGSEKDSYTMLQWAGDSNTLVAFRMAPGERKEVHTVESSPKSGGRAVLRSRRYPLPGDRFDAYELNLFNISKKSQSKPKTDRIDFRRPRLRWDRDGRRFTYEKTDRGHQRFRVIEVDTRTAAVRTVIDEKSKTFVLTSYSPIPLTTYLDRSREIIYASERDGWRHLYLVNATNGNIINQITRGKWVVRGIDRVDEEKRQVWFRASGMDADQDPYLIHFCRVNFDGSGLVRLTAGSGNHTVQYSPDRRYLIDTFSRVDLPPEHELRRVSDGQLICRLEKADISQLKATGWKPPEVFVAKGRDGKTDIWGIISRPREFDPKKKYPVIEDIYAGPHSSFVPKSFSSRDRYRDLTDLGFIVVKIDGMGTANRSKAFHDVCWHNLKDAGFPDRIRWIRSAAAKYPQMDISRVGIYGTSAGGQSAMGALLFHGDFYKAAVAACGCHDNRMDKASWNEQWMGYPVGPHYAASSNVDHAHRLRGKLLLIVGELDTNVPPESTMRVVAALIKAKKDFELLVIPGAGHTSGGSYGRRRLQDFFVRHLQGKTPPDRNAAR